MLRARMSVPDLARSDHIDHDLRQLRLQLRPFLVEPNCAIALDLLALADLEP